MGSDERSSGPQDAEVPLRSRTGPRIALATLGGLLLVLVAAYLVDLGVTSGEIERGTSIAGVPVGGMTPAQATAALEGQVRPRFEEQATLSAHGEKVTFDPADAGLTPDIAEAVAAAGIRSSSPFARIGSFFRSESVPLKVDVDRTVLAHWVTRLAQRTDVARREGSLTLKGTEVAVVRPVTGRSLRVADAVTSVADAWADGGPAALAGLELPTGSKQVRASNAGVDAAVAKVKAILSGPVAVDAAGTALTIDTAAVAEALSIQPDGGQGWTVAVDVGAVRAPLTAAIEKTQQTPKDAGIGLVDGAPAITDSITGRVVNWKTSERGLAAVLHQSSDRTWKVEYTADTPDFTTKDAQALGIDEVIGEFTTKGFVYASGQNIKTLAEKVNGVIVQPGATFSINDFTGPRGVEQGYIEAGIIQDGAAGTAVGGGISQFATTLYNATYFAGMQDVTHTPHSYYISRYPEGREATIFDGLIDLAFTNDHPTAILIQTIWTENDITVKIWGTPAVHVESVTGDRYEFTDPPQKTIPYGKDCSPSDGTRGFSVDNTRIVSDLAGKELGRKTSSTRYNGQFRVICEPPPSSAPSAPPPPAAPPSGPAPGGPPVTNVAPPPGTADSPPTVPTTGN